VLGKLISQMTDEFRIEFSGTSILDSTLGYVDSLVKEAIEIYLTKNNFETVASY
jgi:hypothetical protein